MGKTIGLIVGLIALAFLGIGCGDDPEDLKSQAYGVWEVDAKDIGVGPFKPDILPRMFYEFTEKELAVHVIKPDEKEQESRAGEIWWIIQDDELHFSDGKADNLVVFLDADAMRLELDDRAETKMIMRRSSQEELEKAKEAEERRQAAISAIRATALEMAREALKNATNQGLSMDDRDAISKAAQKVLEQHGVQNLDVGAIVAETLKKPLDKWYAKQEAVREADEEARAGRWTSRVARKVAEAEAQLQEALERFK